MGKLGLAIINISRAGLKYICIFFIQVRETTTK